MVSRKRVTPAADATPASPEVVAAPVEVAPPAPAVEAPAPVVAEVESAPVAKPASKEKAAEKDKSARKPKVVRDSFTMPEADYNRLADLKKLSLSVGVGAKKSELLRAGLQALSKLSADDLAAAITSLESVKTGRPAVEKADPT